SGKCFQEQGDLGRALGIYATVVEQRAPQLARVRGYAVQFRLACLNDPERSDYLVVVREATDWLTENKTLAATDFGIGILFQRALAQEKMAVAAEDSTARESFVRAAMEDAQAVGRYEGQYREPANTMARRLKAQLGEADAEPKDFETAFERARLLVERISAAQDEYRKMKESPEKQQKQVELNALRGSAGQYLQMALDLRSPDTDAKALGQVRYLLSYVYFAQSRNFDAIIMARHCMAVDRVSDPDSAMMASEIAMAAASNAYREAPASDRSFEIRLIRDVCMDILKWYPQSTRGNEARLRLGKAYIDLQQPLQAVSWFLEVPESDPSYVSARIGAGQAYWTAWVLNASKGGDESTGVTHTPEEVRQWRDEARQLLQAGADLWRKNVGADTKPTDEIVQAEMWLAQINNLDGSFQQMIDRLTTGDAASVLAAVSVPEGTTRPDVGVTSASVAGSIYRLLLRAYVGTQQIDKAMQTMVDVEKTGGQDITVVYTQLGRELQEELERLKSSGETARLSEVRQSFEVFLQKVYEGRDPSNTNQLIWIGETYFGLGSGVGDDVTAAAQYFNRASETYSELLQNSQLDPAMLPTVKLRLAKCRRHQQQYEQALPLLTDILTENPLRIDAQFEAAHLLTDWGAEEKNAERQLQAVQGLNGPDNKLLIWGWASISTRLITRLRETP
ncbi:MAG: tetratricopeptide repeat protein, partial [Planctomycetaceae bacterium]|nr:tetratricopeptide repeat protein [Planctomycetaceae bacterium]